MSPHANERILLITAMESAPACAAALETGLRLSVEVAGSRREATAALRRASFSVVIVDEAIAEADRAAADELWKHFGLAIPLELNFAICGCNRMVREVRAALSRRRQEQALAQRAAAASVEEEMRSAVTGLLLQSQLVLAQPEVSPVVTEKIKLIAELAGSLREQLTASC